MRTIVEESDPENDHDQREYYTNNDAEHISAGSVII